MHFRIYKTFVMLVAALSLFAGTAAQAGFTDAEMDTILKRMQSGIAACQAVSSVYQIDCLNQVVGTTAKDLRGQRRHRDSQSAMLSLQRKLAGIVTATEDKQAPRVQAGRSTYRAVKKASLPAANAAARKAVDETVTRLLKSNSKAHLQYVKIAEVVGSTKVLLRA